MYYGKCKKKYREVFFMNCFDWSESSVFGKIPNILISAVNYVFFDFLEKIKSAQRISGVTSGEN